MQSLCYLCLYLLSKHEACFVFVYSINVKFVLFSSFSKNVFATPFHTFLWWFII
jgi:hypothetical protein